MEKSKYWSILIEQGLVYSTVDSHYNGDGLLQYNSYYIGNSKHKTIS